MAFALEVVFENFEIVGVGDFGILFFRTDAKIPHACQQCVDGANVLLDGGGRKRLNEGPLLGDATLLAVLGQNYF